jgi:exodeoxyribonuclease VII large subunit
MSEKINDRTVFSLLEVTKSIQRTLNDRYKSAFWIKAEINKLNFYKHSGHCYPDLVEKKDGKTIAQIRACIWKDDYYRISSKFIAVLNEPLKDGIKALLHVKITFDSAYGLSLLITDIDPDYTLGDIEREKQETIARLRSEGIFDRNRTLSIPLLPQRIAIISVETSKGYADFLKVIETNAWGYRFFMYLFPSLLQGENAIPSIIEQLERILKVRRHFDVVAIIRGGGGDVGLSCFNNYQLVRAIAMFPLPVLTGIGHATNETIAEMVAFSNEITPTKLAEYLLQKFHNFSVPVRSAEKKIIEKSAQLLNREKMKFRAETKLFRSITDNMLKSNSREIVNLTKTLSNHARFIFRNGNDSLRIGKTSIVRGTTVFCNARRVAVGQMKEKLQLQSLLTTRNLTTALNGIEKNVANMNPVNVLRRGYSITQLNNRSVSDISQIGVGDVLNTILHKGNIISIVNSTHKIINNER